MKILQPVLVISLYFIIGAYGLVGLHLIAQGILDLRKRERDARSSIRSLDESRTISERVTALRKCGWSNTWLPGNIGIHAPPARTPTGKAAG